MEEAKNQPDVKTSTHKKKIQVYVIVAVGLIFVILLVLTIISMINNSSNYKNNETFDDLKTNTQNTKQESPKNNRQSFDKLLNTTEQEATTTSYKSSTEPDYAKMPPSDVALTVQKQFDKNYNPYEKSRYSTPEVKVEKTVEQQWLEQEKLRGLNSARSKWIVNQKNDKSNQVQNRNSDNSLNGLKDIDTKRQENKAKIEHLEQVKQQMQYQMSKGNSAEVERLANSINSPINKSFQPAPIDVVGYSKENAYQSDIEGKYKIPVGTVISAVTTMASVSDYMGTFKAMIDYDIYDSTYTQILIPKGTEFMIKPVRASGVNEILQTRMGYTVTWAILPNGNKIDFSKSSGLDRDGIGAVKGDVDYHFFSQFFGVAAYALVSSESSRGSTSANNETSYAGDVGDGLRDQSKPLAQKYINVVPTITVKSGTPIRIIIEDEIYVNSWREVYSDYY